MPATVFSSLTHDATDGVSPDEAATSSQTPFPAFPRLLGLASGLEQLDAEGKGDLARRLTRLGARINPALSVSFGHRFLMRLEDLALAGIPLDAVPADTISSVDIPGEGRVPVSPVGGVALPCGDGERFGRHALVDIAPVCPDGEGSAIQKVRLCVGAFHEFFHTVQELLTGSERRRLDMLLPEPADLPLFERAAEAFGLWVLTVAAPDDLPVDMTERLAWGHHLIATSADPSTPYHPVLDDTFKRLDWFMGEAADHIRAVHPAPGSILPAATALRALAALADEPVFHAVFDGSLFAERHAGAVNYRAAGSPRPPSTIAAFGRSLHRDADAALYRRIVYDTGPDGGDPRLRVEQTGEGVWRIQDKGSVSYHATLHDAIDRALQDDPASRWNRTEWAQVVPGVAP